MTRSPGERSIEASRRFTTSYRCFPGITSSGSGSPANRRHRSIRSSGGVRSHRRIHRDHARLADASDVPERFRGGRVEIGDEQHHVVGARALGLGSFRGPARPPPLGSDDGSRRSTGYQTAMMMMESQAPSGVLEMITTIRTTKVVDRTDRVDDDGLPPPRIAEAPFGPLQPVPHHPGLGQGERGEHADHVEVDQARSAPHRTRRSSGTTGGRGRSRPFENTSRSPRFTNWLGM